MLLGISELLKEMQFSLADLNQEINKKIMGFGTFDLTVTIKFMQ